ncbi:hypothetical protein OsI_26425 [Oryza sativa Indica Group]|uniref:Uncharacterized protein n=1 Tax=Oryza sativa subsp. indica TaxID=39946 RepID=B8B787_ORYSI|nr:hypothetical protein OsI_26425 [Oryza sativa Indica Group]
MSAATAAASRHRSCCRRRYRQSPSSAIAAASCCRHHHHQLSPSPAAAAVTAATTSRRPDPTELARIWGISLLSPPSPAPLCLAAPHGLPPLPTVPMMAPDTVTASRHGCRLRTSEGAPAPTSPWQAAASSLPAGKEADPAVPHDSRR